MSGRMKEINVENLCRLCLSNGFSFSDIFLDRSFSGRLIYEAINFVYNLKIKENDNLPSNICHPCLWKLIEFEAYKRNVLAADTELLDLVGGFRSNSVKDESQPDEILIVEEDLPLLVSENAVEQQEEDMEIPVLGREGETENVVEQQKEDLEMRVLGRVEEVEVIKHQVIPSCTSTNGSNGFSEQYTVEESFPANLQIMDVRSVSTPADNPEMKTVQYYTRSKGLKADVRAVNKLNITDCKSSVLSAVTSNLQKYKHSRNGQEAFKLSCANEYICDICGKSFAFKSNMSYHLESHSNQRVYPCSICQKGFKTNNYRIYHQLSHLIENLDLEMRKRCEDRALRCTICDRRFSRRSNFLSHLHCHGNKFSCVVCGKQFSSKVSFNAHNEAHVRKKEFNCKLCRVSLKSVRAFKTHIIRHSNERPYSCSVCYKSFITKSGHSEHVKTHLEEAM